MSTPSELSLGQTSTVAPPDGKNLLEVVGTQTRAFADRMRGQRPILAPSDILTYRPVSPLLGARLNDYDFLDRIGGEELVGGLKRLKAEHTSTIGFPGFELRSWPQTLGQLYAVYLTNNHPGTMRSVYGFDEEGERFINDRIGRHMEGNLLNPDFRSDTLAMEIFLSLLHTYDIPPLVAIAGLDILSIKELIDLDEKGIRSRLSHNMTNVGSGQATIPTLLSPFEQNEQTASAWLKSIFNLRSDIVASI